MDLQQQLSLTTGGKKEHRRELDFYPTPPECTVALIEYLKDNVSGFCGSDRNPHFKKSLHIWEPACGTGAISEVLKNYGHEVYSSDIHNYGYGNQFDFLNDSLMFDYQFDAIITNPPFNLSTQFIQYALRFAPVVCMLLKSQYWHAAKRLPLFKKTNPGYVLPLLWRPDFLYHERKPGEKANPTMDVCWTIWESGKYTATYQQLEKPKI